MGLMQELKRDLKTLKDARRMQLILWREVIGEYDLEIAADVWDEFKKLDAKYRKTLRELRGE